MTGSIPPSLSDAAPDETFEGWLAYLSNLDVSRQSIRLPEPDGLEESLRYLDVPEAAIPAIIASRPDPDDHHEVWWLLKRCVAALTENLGVVGRMPRFLPLPPRVIENVPHFYIHVFLAALPDVRAYHASKGIPEEDTQASLADLGRNVRVHEKWHGDVGLGVYDWISLHFRGLIFDLGRLQFERAHMRTAITEALIAQGVDADAEEIVLSLHIPDFKGPLAPEAVDAAILRARSFFSRYFPEDRIRYAVCHSWLLDPQLARYLPGTSNIVRFQHRFELSDRITEADRTIVKFVVGPIPDDPHDLPARTSLERAVRNHLVEGKHWHSRSGWFTWE